MTVAELKEAIRTVLTPRITKEKEAEAMDLIIDFIAGNIGDDFPDWTAELVFQTDGTDAGKNCKHPDSEGKVRLWETKTDDNEDNEPPTDPEVTENSNWKEVSAAGSGTSQSIFKARPVKAASTAALGVAYTLLGNGDLEANANGAFPAIDGVTINLNDDILLKDESTITNNGIWKLSRVGTGSVKWLLSRRNDALATGAEGPVYSNSFVYVKSNSATDQSPNINAGKIFKCMDGVDNHWHEYEHEFIHHYSSPPSLTAGDVVQYDMSKVSALTQEPYAVFVKALSGNYRLFRRSGLLNGVITGATIGAKYFVQANGTLSTSATLRLFGVAVKSNSINIINIPLSTVSTVEDLIAVVDLSTAQILSGNSAPPELVAAPGAGYMFAPYYVVMDLKSSGVAFATNTGVRIRVGVTEVFIMGGSPLTSTVNRVLFQGNNGNNIENRSTFENQNINFFVPVGNPTAGGTSTMRITVKYLKITLS